MKLLNDKEHALLLSQSNAFVAIQTALVESSEGITPEEITADTVIEALQGNSLQGAITELQTQVDATQELLTASELALSTATARVSELETELAALEEIPATPSATITPSGDGGKETMTIAQFADKNVGDTEAILAQAIKEGLI